MTHIVCPVGWGAGVEASHRDRRTPERAWDDAICAVCAFASHSHSLLLHNAERERDDISVASFLTSNLQRSLFKSFLGSMSATSNNAMCVQSQCVQPGPKSKPDAVLDSPSHGFVMEVVRIVRDAMGFVQK